MRDRTAIEIDLMLIRHGETPANQEHRYLGSTEEHLSLHGIAQMQRSKEKLAKHSPDLLLVSPRIRCRESAEILYKSCEQIVITEWAEMDFGQYEGKNYLDLKGDPYYQQWIDSNGTLPFPDGESQAQFINRCQKGWIKALDHIRKFSEMQKGEMLLKIPMEEKISAAAVVHGGTIMALMSIFTGGSYFDYQAKNGCGYHLRMELSRDKLVKSDESPAIEQYGKYDAGKAVKIMLVEELN